MQSMVLYFLSARTARIHWIRAADDGRLRRVNRSRSMLNIAIAQFISGSRLRAGPHGSHGYVPGISGARLSRAARPCGVASNRLHARRGMSLHAQRTFDERMDARRIGRMTSARSLEQPLTYRTPYAGYVRLYPQPGPGNAVGPGIGVISLTGAPSIVDEDVHHRHGRHTNRYHADATRRRTTDTNYDDHRATANAAEPIRRRFPGNGAFLQPSSPISNNLNLTAITPPGTNITYEVVTTSTTMTATPKHADEPRRPTGDTITFYYSSLGVILVNPGDTPGLPPGVSHGARVSRSRRRVDA